MSQLEEEILKQNVLEEHRQVHDLQVKVNHLRAMADHLEAQRNCAWEELIGIRAAVKANAGESTLDEVERHVAASDRLRQKVATLLSTLGTAMAADDVKGFTTPQKYQQRLVAWGQFHEARAAVEALLQNPTQEK